MRSTPFRSRSRRIEPRPERPAPRQPRPRRARTPPSRDVCRTRRLKSSDQGCFCRCVRCPGKAPESHTGTDEQARRTDRRPAGADRDGSQSRLGDGRPSSRGSLAARSAGPKKKRWTGLISWGAPQEGAVSSEKGARTLLLFADALLSVPTEHRTWPVPRRRRRYGVVNRHERRWLRAETGGRPSCDWLKQAPCRRRALGVSGCRHALQEHVETIFAPSWWVPSGAAKNIARTSRRPGCHDVGTFGTRVRTKCPRCGGPPATGSEPIGLRFYGWSSSSPSAGRGMFSPSSRSFWRKVFGATPSTRAAWR